MTTTKPLNFSFDGIDSGDFSLGHRFLKPDKFQVENLSSYIEQSANHFLMVDPELRKQLPCSAWASAVAPQKKCARTREASPRI